MAVVIARSAEEFERLRARWPRVAWEREEAEIDWVLLRARTRPGVIAPFALVVGREAGIAGRIEERPLPARLGDRTVVAPRARVLKIVEGGVVGASAVEALRPVLREVDAVAFPPLPVGSELAGAARGLGGVLRRQPLAPASARRRLVLPASFEEFLASRTRKVRDGIRYDSARLEEAFGRARHVRTLHRPEDLEQLVGTLDLVARSTYQRAVGAGFADTLEERALARLGLERGWIRAYVLYCGQDPIAYWQCSTYRGTLFLLRTGFDRSYSRHRPGIYLLMRVLEDAIADPSIGVVDFGAGDAAYKRQLSSESSLEREELVFAPTWRGLRASAVRAPVLAGARLARRAADAARLTDGVRSRWRERVGPPR
ncbi:MAG TPA: GNAT family N-acetyltransferase [Gaiellaceae bacterium]|nr:GNAT family N-acetyltransferase [Gaiellaceae bacterium]